MSLRLLLCDPDENYKTSIKEYFGETNYEVESALDGKEAQLMAYNMKYLAAILDLDTKNHSGIEVLKYFSVSKPGMKVILTVSGQEKLEEMGLNEKDLKKLGADDIIVKPYDIDALKSSIEGTTQFKAWKNVEAKETQSGETQVDASDEEFTKLPIGEFVSGKTTIFDCYIRMSENKYLKILHQGEGFDHERLSHYKEKIEFLYFRNEDRRAYISFMDDLAGRLISSDKVETSVKMSAAKNLTEKYLEEVYLQGITPDLVEQGKSVVGKVEKLVNRNRDLSKFLREYEDFNPEEFGHLYLVTFFSTLIANNVEWGSPSTTEKVAMGSMLHDIGKLKLDKELVEKRPENMNDEELFQYQKHPRFGADLLYSSKGVPEPVRQIVYQHHELNTGEGFPNGLSGIKIYPLAKIVSLADYFSHLLAENKCSPLDGLRLFIPDREEVLKFDPEIIKALVSGFIEKK